MGDVELPSLPISIENMTRDSLRSFIPQMIRVAEKRENPDFGCKAKKPQWWPAYAPWAPLRCDIRDTDSKTRISWTEELRNIVRCCYRYHNSEHMLHVDSTGDDQMPILTPQIDIAAQSNFSGKVPASLEARIPIAPISQMCEVSLSPLPKYFINSGDVPEQAPIYTMKSHSQVRTSARLQRKTEDDVHEIFLCKFCNSEFKTKPALYRHQKVCCKGPGNTGQMFKIPDCPPAERVEQIHVDHLPRARKVDLTERLGLLPLSKAKVVRKQRNRVREIQITKLDDSEKDSAIKSPTTPRGKSLMSQLSRDFSPPVKVRRKSLFTTVDEDGARKKSTEGSDAESVCSKTSEKADNDQPKDPWNKEKRTSILSIDFSSPLGMRVVNLMNQQAEKMLQYAEESTTNYEEFCRTPKKSDLIRRLRDRKDMITFKKNRRICPKWAHSYKFTTAERIEWYRTIRTGLNARSRPLRKLLKKCSVRVTRLNKEEIKTWTERKPRPEGYYSHPNGQWAHGGNGMRMNGHQNMYNSYYNRAQNKGYNLLHQSPLLKSMLGQSPDQLRAMSQNYPVPNGIYVNANMPGHFDIPRAVAQNVVRNLHAQMNFGQSNQTKVKANHKTDFNGNKARVHKPRSNTPIVIDDDDDDVYSISSEEIEKKDGPPTKKRKVETETSLLFKCHLCGEELTTNSGSFASYIEKHFADRHNVRTIQLIEHIDQNGQKVVSIVEKQVANTDSKKDKKNKKEKSSALRPNARNSVHKLDPRADEPRMKGRESGNFNSDGRKRNKSNRSHNNSSPESVICID